MFIFIGLGGAEIDLVAYKNDWHFIINFIDPGHPVSPESLDAIKFVNIIDKDDDISFLNLAVCVLLILPLGARVNQLCVHLVRQ